MKGARHGCERNSPYAHGRGTIMDDPTERLTYAIRFTKAVVACCLRDLSGLIARPDVDDAGWDGPMHAFMACERFLPRTGRKCNVAFLCATDPEIEVVARALVLS